jgi:hypothetical protein
LLRPPAGPRATRLLLAFLHAHVPAGATSTG